MFLDEIKLSVYGGNGGDGSIHFARRKYQPFGGPDGGDGGDGGQVILQATREVESLNHLKTFNAKASHGKSGGGNLITGARGEDCYIQVPPGTIAYNVRTMEEIATVKNVGEEQVVAQGGKGGKGNPHYASGSRRAPQMAQEGTEGEEKDILIRYRIFSGTALIEPAQAGDGTLLPALLGRDARDVDWGVYLRKPRWVRVQNEYQRFDVAYLPILGEDAESLVTEFLPHLFWAESALLNLVPYEDFAVEIADLLFQRIIELPLRRLNSIAVAATTHLTAPHQLKTDGGVCMLNCAVLDSVQDIRELLASQLSGGIVG